MEQSHRLKRRILRPKRLRTSICIGKDHQLASKASGIAFKTCLQFDVSGLAAASWFFCTKRHGFLRAPYCHNNTSSPADLSCVEDSTTMCFDFVVVGSGVAGLMYALEVSKHGSVAIITKDEPQESNTNYAQGGVSAVFCPSDSVENHMHDTIVAGAYLCDEETVKDNTGMYCHRVDVLNTKTQQVTMLASGGVGHIYPTTTNPLVRAVPPNFRAGLHDETNVCGLFVVGEVACTGLPR